MPDLLKFLQLMSDPSMSQVDKAWSPDYYEKMIYHNLGEEGKRIM